MSLEKQKWLDIVKSVNPSPVEVNIASWGESFFVLPLTVEELEEIEKNEGDKRELIFRVALGALCTEEGERLYDEETFNPEDFVHLPADGVFELYECVVNRVVRERSRVQTLKKPTRRTPI